MKLAQVSVSAVPLWPLSSPSSFSIEMDDDLSDDAIDVDDPGLAWLDKMASMRTQRTVVADNEPERSEGAPEAPAAQTPTPPIPQVSTAAMALAPVTQEGSRYSLWVDPILQALAPVIAKRGRQMHKPLINSGCTSLCSEAKALNKLGWLADFGWVCDPYAGSVRFVQANGPVCKHHFADLAQVAQTGESFCFTHTSVCRAVVIERGGVLYIVMVAGTSCCPYSTFRKGRSDGTADHAEGHLAEAFLDEVARQDYDEALFENVFGMGIRESRQEERSPLQNIVESAGRKCPQHHVQVYYMNGELHNILCRRRIFVHLLHQRRGGAQTHSVMNNFVQAVINNKNTK